MWWYDGLGRVCKLMRLGAGLGEEKLTHLCAISLYLMLYTA